MRKKAKSNAPVKPGDTKWSVEKREKAARRAALLLHQTPPEEVDLSVTPENVLRHIACICFFDPRNIYDENHELKPLYALDKTTAIALTGIEVTPLGITKYRFPTRNQQLQLLGTFLKLFEGTLKDHGALDELLVEFRKQYERLSNDDEPNAKDS